MPTHVVIVAAGKGSRFGGELPKQFCLLGDRPVLMHTAIRIARLLPNARLSIVLSQEFADFWEKMCEKYGFVSPQVIIGGETRWESVKNAIQAINPADDDVVLIHDGVRPLVTKDMVDNIMTSIAAHDGVVPVVPVTDTLRHIDDDGASHTVDRSKLVAVQTPQAFKGAAIRLAYQLPYSQTFTDDASVFEAAGYPAPAMVGGSPLNIKITHPRDIEVAALFMGVK